MSDLHKDAPPELQQSREKYHDERFHQLNGLLTSSSGAAWSYLLAVNGGAAAGILAFIGAKASVAVQMWPYAVLSLFVLGLLCVGFAHAAIVHKVQGLLQNWSSTMERYWKNQVGWDYLMERDQDLVYRWRKVPWILGWLSLLLFIAGIIVTAWNFHRMASPN
ncbi:MAG: hypothetical protein CVU22_09080 [Betaproteobacteria bacterium HGW-Betaproteobacteria-16]|nr:MAG: hypothetical protein CVU22_09080 [Betaproteobacteria bacterium HGW-Betaproteobacteria-16]